MRDEIIRTMCSPRPIMGKVPIPRAKTPPARRGPRTFRTHESDRMEDEALERFLDPDA